MYVCTGVMCRRNIRTKLTDKVYKTAIKPAMVYVAECWPVRKKEERKLHTTEMCMLRWTRGKMRLDHVRNVDIWKETHMYPMAEFLREKRLRWFRHVQSRDKDEATRKIIQMTVLWNLTNTVTHGTGQKLPYLRADCITGG